MSELTVSGEFHFEAAHMLSSYKGKCNNLHGHSYKLRVTVSAGMDEESCMVLDYNTLKQVEKKWVDDVYDHSLLISALPERELAEEALLNWAERFGKNYVVLSSKSTSETIIRDIYSRLREGLAADCFGHCNFGLKLTLWETEKCFCSYEE